VQREKKNNAILRAGSRPSFWFAGDLIGLVNPVYLNGTFSECE